MLGTAVMQYMVLVKQCSQILASRFWYNIHDVKDFKTMVTLHMIAPLATEAKTLQ